MRVIKLNDIDRAALARAQSQGWLTLTRETSGATFWARERQCAGTSQPFAVVRPEPRRVTIWLTLAPGREWSEAEQQLVAEALCGAAGVVLCPVGVRAFAPLGAEQTIMPRLLALARAASCAGQTAEG